MAALNGSVQLVPGDASETPKTGWFQITLGRIAYLWSTPQNLCAAVCVGWRLRSHDYPRVGALVFVYPNAKRFVHDKSIVDKPANRIGNTGGSGLRKQGCFVGLYSKVRLIVFCKLNQQPRGIDRPPKYIPPPRTALEIEMQPSNP